MKKRDPKLATNIVLLGFTGSGKTTAGIILAKRLNFQYIDTYRYIEEMTGSSIDDILQNGGDEAFAEEEHRAMSELAGQVGCVITTGCSVAMREDNLPQMRENGKIIYINTPFSLCYQRISTDQTSLAQKYTREELSDMYKLYRSRYRAHSDFEVSGISGSRPAVRAALDALGLTEY